MCIRDRPKAEIVIEFLSKHCADAVSSDDLQHMAMQDRLTLEHENGY